MGGAATLWLGVASHLAEPSRHPLTPLGGGGASLPLNLPEVPELQWSPDWLGFVLKDVFSLLLVS